MLLHSLSPSRTLELGIDAKILPRLSVDEIFDAIAGYGLTCAEWNWGCAPGLSSLPDAIPREIVRSVAQAAKRAGVRSCACSAKFNLLQTGTDSQLQTLPMLAEATASLESNLLILCNEFPAVNLASRQNIFLRKTTPKTWNNAIATLRRASQIARGCGIRLAIQLDRANVICDAQTAEMALDELGPDSDHLSIALDAASLYRPAIDPSLLSEVIDDALARLGEYVALAYADDVEGPALEEEPAASPSSRRLTAIGTGIVPYSHYLIALVETPAIVAAAKHSQRLPLILRGLSEKEVPASTKFVRELIEVLDHAWRSRLLNEFVPVERTNFDPDPR